MPVPRACKNCRESKVRCDGRLPVCGRCVRRSLVTCDIGNARQFVFRDETNTAQRLSERARGQPTNARSASYAPQPTEISLERSSQPSSPGEDAFDLHQQYPWLNERAIAEIPEPLKRDVEARAVERFFVDWTVHPSAASPGHMHHLPMLYENAPAGTVLPLVVKAVAFADTRNARDANNIPFDVRAQRAYGSALACMRTIADNEEGFANDGVLAALLLFDCYESVYLAKTDLLGSHSDAIHYIIHARGMDQLYHHPRFCLWRVANWQLQARQILRGEEPSAIQYQLVSKLNLDRPELHISADVLRISALCAASKQLLADSAAFTGQQKFEDVDRAAGILLKMSELNNSIHAWMSILTGPWKPASEDPERVIRSTEEVHFSTDLHYHCALSIYYTDASLACIWNFHSACQIVLREWCIRLLLLGSRLTHPHDLDPAGLERIGEQKVAIQKLSGSIIRSVPLLMGFADIAYTSRSSPARSYEGTMVARYLGLFTMIVIQKAEYTSAEHKITAAKVMEQIWTRHKL